MRLPDRSSRMIPGCSAEDSLRVTLANWQEAPWNLWSFQRLREALATAPTVTTQWHVLPTVRELSRSSYDRHLLQ